MYESIREHSKCLKELSSWNTAMEKSKQKYDLSQLSRKIVEANKLPYVIKLC